MNFIAFYFGFFFLSILRFSHVEKWSKRKLLMAPIMYYYINDHGDNTTLRKERGTTHINSVPVTENSITIITLIIMVGTIY